MALPLPLGSCQTDGGELATRSLTRAAFLSARNDVFANAAIIAAGLITAVTFSFWSDLIVGIGIAIMNADAAKEIWEAAEEEKAQLEVEP